MIRYSFVIVGGPHDGVAGMKWDDDGAHPTPDVILVGRCGKAMDCGSSTCKRNVVHVSFWLPEEADRPVRVIRYEKQEDLVERNDKTGELAGKTVYAIGGLLDPRNFGALAHEPAGAVPPLTYAGLSGYQVGGSRDAGLRCRCVLAPLPPGCPACRRPRGSLHTPTCPFRATTR